VGGLLVNGRVVEPVTDKTQPEDGSSERIAGGVGAATKQVRQELVMVFWRKLVR
jgi:hypothetical protein